MKQRVPQMKHDNSHSYLNKAPNSQIKTNQPDKDIKISRIRKKTSKRQIITKAKRGPK